jgi:ADP-ribose pyrophosphatase YjhB (NUDIX family)
MIRAKYFHPHTSQASTPRRRGRNGPREVCSQVIIVMRGAKTFRRPRLMEGTRFVLRVRVAALAIRNGRILLARHVKNARTSYLLPGGGMETNETARQALARELREEAGVTSAIGDLQYVVEARSPNGSKHLLQLVFSVEIDGDVGPSTDTRVAACEWHDVESLRTLDLHPAIGAILADDIQNGGTPPCRYLVAPWVV